MRKFALIIAIMGIGILSILLFGQPKRVSSLENLRIGTLVAIEGVVSEEKSFSFGKTFNIDKIPVFCECSNSYNGKNVSIIGVIENYYSLRVRVLEIRIIYNK